MPSERNSSSRSNPKQDTSTKKGQKDQEDQERGRCSSEMMTVSSMGMTDILAHRPHFSPDILDSDGYSISGLSPPIFISDNNSDSDSPAVVVACSQVEEALHRLSVDYEDLVIRREKMKLRGESRSEAAEREQREREREQLSMLALVLTTLRRSLLSCKTSEEESTSSMEIGWPTNVRHVTHVTFDRFNGFLGLPVEFEIEIPRRVPSASASVFGVSPESMQCSYDAKGNSVPTILLLMQERLYSQGGLKAEGIFRINAENSHEESVREQLNRGTVPHDIDLHCLAGLIKAWFRELPKGVLDSLTPEQVMRCHTEEDCVELVKLLPQTQAALLDWAVNLMADVAQAEAYNKMNARNVAMVFAPNMTQMADPLTALMHAVQVMNFLKTLIQRTMRDRQEAVLDPGPAPALATTRGDDDKDEDDSYAGGTTIGTNDDPDSGKFKEHEEHQRHHQQQQGQQQPAPARAQAVVVHSKKQQQQQQQRIKGGKARGARLINRIDKQSERAEAW